MVDRSVRALRLMTAQSLKRLELAGRLESAAESATKPDTNAKVKISPMPSLSDIRARLNQRGVDVTSSKWVQGSGTKSSQTLPVSETTKENSTVVTSPSKDVSQHDAVSTAATQHGDATSTHSSEAMVPPVANQAPSSLNTKKDTCDAPAHTPAVSGREAAMAAKHGRKHPLQDPWTLYYDMQRHHGNSSKDQYEATLKCVGHFTTLESFFDTFATLHRPSRLEKNANYHLFKQGIKPMWEDPANAQGGRWVITLRDRGQSAGSHAAHEALVDRTWMWLVLALIGDTLEDNDLVTGAVCSLRSKGDRITLWTRRKEPIDELNSLATRVLRLLELEDQPGIQLEFGVNSGSKEPGYLKQHFAGKQPESETGAPSSCEPALESWLESDYTLHPTDHMRYMAHLKAKNDEQGEA